MGATDLEQLGNAAHLGATDLRNWQPLHLWVQHTSNNLKHCTRLGATDLRNWEMLHTWVQQT